MPAASSRDPALAIVLAAGQGTRMKSQLPKVLLPVGGRPMVRYVLDALNSAGIQRTVVVVGYGAELVRAELDGQANVSFAVQRDQLGTGHAVMMCREQLAAQRGPVLIVAGDSPMLQASSVRKLLDAFHEGQYACLLGTVEREDPTGYGRIVRDGEGNFIGIVEEKDATDAQRAIREINVSIYVFDPAELLAALEKLTDQNAQGEYYITDCPAILMSAGKQVEALKVLEPCESLGINSMEELATVEKTLQRLAKDSCQPSAEAEG
ncbi:MAG: NTP transferase domain-containing protein [Planctomycetes bacterium]|nr:NTP transferase domain-containing protein [Planctomycetota bacterium]